jgi:hypothetical protein
VGPGAAQAIDDVDGWARREPAVLACQCRYAYRTKSRPWTYEYRD